MFAGHLPKMQFDHEHWLAMPVWLAPAWPPDGFYRGHIKGKPFVGYMPPLDSGDVFFSVRPVVRVPMNRAVEV